MSCRCLIDHLFSYFLSHLHLTLSTYHLPFLVTLVVWLLGQSLHCTYLTSVKLIYMTLLYRTVVNMSQTSQASTQMTHWVFNVLNPHCQVYLYCDVVWMFRIDMYHAVSLSRTWARAICAMCFRVLSSDPAWCSSQKSNS